MKSYKEIAANVLKRRDEYLAKQKRKKRLLTAILPTVGCVAVLAICFGLWGSGAFDTRIPIADPQDGVTTTTSVDAVHSTTQTVPSQSTTTVGPTETTTTTTRPTSASTTTTTTTAITTTTPSTTTSTTRPTTTTTTQSIKEPFVIDSIDKVNFYSAKKILTQNLLPFHTSDGKTPPLSRMSSYVEYPIDREKTFTVTMVTYFLIELHDENGFLAQKLGGAGTVEVVVIQNDIDDLGRMITFKRGNTYYTCLTNGGGTESDATERCDFSSHKYIDGFNLVKNLEQENYRFTVRYEGSKVVGFECEPFKSTPSVYTVDEVTFIENYCAVIFTKQYFTIDMLETFFGGTQAEETV